MRLIPCGAAEPETDLLARLHAPEISGAERERLWQAFTSRWQGRLFAFARTLTRDDLLAEEVVQDTYVDLWKVLARRDTTIENLKGWLFKLVSRKAMKALHSRRRNAPMPAEAVPERSLPAAGENDQAEIRLSLRRLVEALPDRLRLPILLHFVSGNSQVDVAKLVGCRQSTVSERLSEAMEKLKKDLTGLGYVGPLAGVVVLLKELFMAPAFEGTKAASAAEIAALASRTSRHAVPLPASTAASPLIIYGMAAVAFVGAAAAIRAMRTPSDSPPPAPAFVVAAHPSIPTAPPQAPRPSPASQAATAKKSPIPAWDPLADDWVTVPDLRAQGVWSALKHAGGLTVRFVPAPHLGRVESYAYVGPNRRKPFEVRGTLEAQGHDGEDPLLRIGICHPNRFNYDGFTWIGPKSGSTVRFHLQVWFDDRGCRYAAALADEQARRYVTGEQPWTLAPWTRGTKRPVKSTSEGWAKFDGMRECGPAFCADGPLTLRNLEIRPLVKEALLYPLEEDRTPPNK